MSTKPQGDYDDNVTVAERIACRLVDNLAVACTEVQTAAEDCSQLSRWFTFLSHGEPICGCRTMAELLDHIPLTSHLNGVSLRDAAKQILAYEDKLEKSLSGAPLKIEPYSSKPDGVVGPNQPRPGFGDGTPIKNQSRTV
jgi:hypothetical protein